MDVTTETTMPRKVQPVILAIDSSGSMRGEKIQSVQEFMNDFPAMAPDLARTLSARIQIGVLQFSDNAKWLNEHGLEDAEEGFAPVHLQAEGTTRVGDMLDELNRGLSRKRMLADALGNYMPVIIFITDGMTTQEYGQQLDEIRSNKFFHYASKIGIAVGQDADTSMIANLTGSDQSVISLNKVSMLAELIQQIVVTSTMLNTGTRRSVNKSTTETVVEDARKLLKDDPTAKVGEENNIDPNSYIPEPEYVEPKDLWNAKAWNGAGA